VFRMSDVEAEAPFAKVRWADQRRSGMPQVRPQRLRLPPAEWCRPAFVAAGARAISRLPAGRSLRRTLPLKAYLAAIAIFCNKVKGKAALALSRDRGTPYKAALIGSGQPSVAHSVPLGSMVRPLWWPTHPSALHFPAVLQQAPSPLLA
jgi:hypothetical protein